MLTLQFQNYLSNVKSCIEKKCIHEAAVKLIELRGHLDDFFSSSKSSQIEDDCRLEFKCYHDIILESLVSDFKAIFEVTCSDDCLSFGFKNFKFSSDESEWEIYKLCNMFSPECRDLMHQSIIDSVHSVFLPFLAHHTLIAAQVHQNHMDIIDTCEVPDKLDTISVMLEFLARKFDELELQKERLFTAQLQKELLIVIEENLKALLPSDIDAIDGFRQMYSNRCMTLCTKFLSLGFALENGPESLNHILEKVSNEASMNAVDNIVSKFTPYLYHDDFTLKTINPNSELVSPFSFPRCQVHSQVVHFCSELESIALERVFPKIITGLVDNVMIECIERFYARKYLYVRESSKLSPHLLMVYHNDCHYVAHQIIVLQIVFFNGARARYATMLKNLGSRFYVNALVFLTDFHHPGNSAIQFERYTRWG
jgi:hypothetical protein